MKIDAQNKKNRAFDMYVLSIKNSLDVIFTLTFVAPLVWNSVYKLFPFIDK
jgi:hypothetical protein